MKKIILIGYGGHAKSVADSINQGGEYEIVGFTDKEPPKEKSRFTYLGNDNILQQMFDTGVSDVAICVGYMGKSNLRDKLYTIVKQIGYRLPAIIDRTSILAEDVQIGEGSYIGKGAIINANSEIGKMCIVNSGAIIEHENVVGSYSHISVGAVLCGNVKIKDHVFIGANATVKQGVTIYGNSIIGAASMILRDVPENMNLHGIWKGEDFL